MILRREALIVVLVGLAAALAAPCGPTAAKAEVSVEREIVLRLDPESREIAVSDRFTIDAGRNVIFDLAPWMRVEEARVNGATVSALRRGGREVRLSVAAEGPQHVELRLRGLVPSLPPPEARGRGSGAVAGPEGSYLPSYSGWLPVPDAGRMRYRLEVEVPANQKAVATGRLVSETVEGDRYRATFLAERPGEAPSVFIGPYAISEKRLEGLRLRTYFHPELAGFAESYLETAGAYIERFAAEIGPYPFADFHIISAPLPVGYGFPNLTYVSRRIVPLPFMRGRSLAHEVLHNWWGNGVAVDYRTGNWSEGLTTYMADYALAQEAGGGEEMRLGWLRNLSALSPERDRPIASFVSKTHDASQAVGYDKTAFLFHVLRQEIGDEAFSAGLREFWRRGQFKIAGWEDLRRAFEQAAGRDLAWFFDQWLRRKGLPRIQLHEAARRGDGDRYLVSLTLRQDEPHYRLRVPLVIKTTAGQQRATLDLRGREASLTLPVEAEPLSVAVDPGFDLLRRLLPGESAPIIRDVTLAEETAVLILTGDPTAAEAARRLADRLLQRRYSRIEAGEAAAGVPLLVIGTRKQVQAFRSEDRGGLYSTLAGRGTARVWTESGADGAPRLFVEADDQAALAALLRPLPHYRSRGFLVFEASKAVEIGVSPAPASPLTRSFAAE